MPELNKGEARNSLARRFLQPPRRNQDRSYRAASATGSGLNLVTAAIVCGNGVLGTRPQAGLAKRGSRWIGELLQYLVAAGVEHINPDRRLCLAAEPQLEDREVSAARLPGKP